MKLPSFHPDPLVRDWERYKADSYFEPVPGVEEEDVPLIHVEFAKAFPTFYDNWLKGKGSVTLYGGDGPDEERFQLVAPEWASEEYKKKWPHNPYRGIGRPPKENTAPKEKQAPLASQAPPTNPSSQTPQPKKRGRPKGSKNKEKYVTADQSKYYVTADQLLPELNHIREQLHEIKLLLLKGRV